MENKENSSTNVTNTPESTKNKIRLSSRLSTKRSKNTGLEKDTLFGVPKHVEVIKYITKTRKNNLSWISDINIPPKQLRKF
jgi:hypothetical protein